MKKNLLGLCGLLLVGSTSYAQTRGSLPVSLVNEEKEFIDAVMKVRHDYMSTDLLETFISRHPSSRFLSQAILELEKAQILASGRYSYAMPTPQLYQFRPSEQPIQYIYENFNELNGEDPDYNELRKKYNLLISQFSDPVYDNEVIYYLGYLDYVDGKYDDALLRFNSLPDEQKYKSSVPFYKMQMLYAKGDIKQTLKLINTPGFIDNFTKPEQKEEMIRIKAECLANIGDNMQALELYKQYINATDNPVSVSAYNCAVLAYEKGEYKLAEKALSMAVNSNDNQVCQYAYMLLGQTYMLTGETPKAKMAFEQAASISADTVVQEAAAYNKAVLIHETSYSPWGDEVTLFESFLNTYPNSRYADNVSTYLSEVYMTTKNYGAALASINKIKQPNSKILEAKQRLLYECGISDYVNGNYVSAEKRFTDALSVSANNQSVKALAHFWRGESRYHLEAFTDAASDYTTFISLSSVVNDNHIKAVGNYSLGYVFFKLHNFEDATRCFERYTSFPAEHGSETYYDAIVRLGDCAYYTRDFIRAESYYSTVTETNCNSTPYALYQEAFMMGLQKKYAHKQQTLDKLIALYPESDYSDDAWLEKGNTSLLQNDNSAAINSFDHIIKNYPESPCAPQAAVQLAMTYNSIGQTDKAQKTYEMVAEKYPNTEEALSALQDLKTLSTNNLFAEMPVALANGEHQKVIDIYNRLSNENIDFRDLQKIQLMAAKAYFAKDQLTDATNLLEACSADTRTEAGSEAKYLLAQRFFDSGNVDASLKTVNEFIQQGSSHQYWLARAIILMSDISVKNEDTFTATEYLKSLKSNYTENDDIQSMIEQRLSNLLSE